MPVPHQHGGRHGERPKFGKVDEQLSEEILLHLHLGKWTALLFPNRLGRILL